MDKEIENLENDTTENVDDALEQLDKELDQIEKEAEEEAAENVEGMDELNDILNAENMPQNPIG